MAYLEERFLDQCTVRPITYSRYIDDTFFLWPHGKRSLTRFIDKVNSFHLQLNLHFLDIQVALVNDTIQTFVFKKPTDRQTYKSFTSSHSEHPKISIIYYQTFLYKRVCSGYNNLNIQLNELTKQFMLRGYPLKLIRKNMERANKVSRQELLKYKNVTSPERTIFTANFLSHCERSFQTLLNSVGNSRK
ncbi:hypothetical protein HOLleu_12962 [Holothuria leucospilota]|uniref:Helix-turn-helix domain-containing protein n=1 Tax=Holothuria leucospilota TaxID=206669 RepID=A0A9Q1HEB0_HOLLE|nr:hypothetical protein HOLleu_12962 [Holothuria leucospilota]